MTPKDLLNKVGDLKLAIEIKICKVGLKSTIWMASQIDNPDAATKKIKDQAEKLLKITEMIEKF